MRLFLPLISSTWRKFAGTFSLCWQWVKESLVWVELYFAWVAGCGRNISLAVVEGICRLNQVETKVHPHRARVCPLNFRYSLLIICSCLILQIITDTFIIFSFYYWTKRWLKVIRPTYLVNLFYFSEVYISIDDLFLID